jgi:hypothetical protein
LRFGGLLGCLGGLVGGFGVVAILGGERATFE